jgi:hypothetical protein
LSADFALVAQAYHLERGWKSLDENLQNIEAMLKAQRAVVQRGGDYDSWDLEVRGGLLGKVRLRMTIEEHGAGKQLLRFHTWAKLSVKWVSFAVIFAVLSYLASISEAWVVSATFATVVLLLARCAFGDCAIAMFTVLHALKELNGRHSSPIERKRRYRHRFPNVIYKSPINNHPAPPAISL